YVIEPALWDAGWTPRTAFLAGCLTEVDAGIGGRLLVRRGEPVVEVVSAARAVSAGAVYVTPAFTPHGIRRDEAVAKALAEHGIELRAVSSDYAVAPGALLSGAGTGYRVFGAYQRAWLAAGSDAPADVGAVPWRDVTALGGQRVPSVPTDVAIPPPGETAASERLTRFLARNLDAYAAARDTPSAHVTSGLSPYLRFGCIHPRTVLWELHGAGDNDKFRSELCWREFSADLLWHQREMSWTTLRIPLRDLRWDQGPRADANFEAWCRGRTGYPIVDAGMRELLATGIMHNRVRMIVASFLVKDLHLDWQRGAHWFLERLVDGDLASNSQNWQWVAGTGVDPAPFFRIFNPTTQGRKFDAAGRYVRQWVPELQGIDDRYVHEPWKAPTPPAGYPAPIVDHDHERRETLARFEETRRS
ncbi:MAG: deoxyribodipyrimidine photolyase, partial [Acidimicrobiia bacterium]|nr:deoxyribodipyrimidine photolyase [Acidimicrobiia bacterium]